MKSFDQSSLAQCDEPDTGATTAITAYQALIRTEDGAFRDEGLALSSVTQTPGTFVEHFLTGSTTPLTKQDCRDPQYAELVEAVGGEKACKDLVKGKEAD